MLAKTPGIVIRNTKYGEGSVISKIYTRQFGMESYIINGVYGAKAAIKASLLQPLTMLDLVVYHNRLKEIQRIKEAKAAPQLYHLHFDVVKSSIGMFISELLNKAIKEEEPNETLYDFVADFILKIDNATSNLSLWPEYFMLQLTRFLGFFPGNNYEEEEHNYFDLVEGNFDSFPQKSDYAIGPPVSEYFSQLINIHMNQLSEVHFPKAIRAELLNKLILYYKLHLPDFQDIKSVEVLAGLSG
jgi:DNA repair protein RecO (recombination protein O)